MRISFTHFSFGRVGSGDANVFLKKIIFDDKVTYKCLEIFY